MRIGLTGGIASGKSLVAGFFEELGVPVIDTDVVAREVVAPGMPALDEIQAEFGAAVIATDGSLDRQAMRRIVFSNDQKRSQLENILHPLIQASAARRAEAAEGPYVIIVVPLLFESPMKESMDRILVVDCSEQTQLRRLTARDNEDEMSARRIMATQATRQERLSIADDVITNDGSLDDTRAAVAALHDFYLSLDRN
ncbi:MAG: dephospho-CoA kinase [Woeseiaceae bacterium]